MDRRFLSARLLRGGDVMRPRARRGTPRFQGGAGRETASGTDPGGGLAGQVDQDDVVDLTVVEGALRRDDAVVTSDRTDIHRIVGAIGRKLRAEAV